MQGSTRAGGATARQLMLRVGSRRLRTAGQLVHERAHSSRMVLDSSSGAERDPGTLVPCRRGRRPARTAGAQEVTRSRRAWRDDRVRTRGQDRPRRPEPGSTEDQAWDRPPRTIGASRTGSGPSRSVVRFTTDASRHPHGRTSACTPRRSKGDVALRAVVPDGAQRVQQGRDYASGWPRLPGPAPDPGGGDRPTPAPQWT